MSEENSSNSFKQLKKRFLVYLSNLACNLDLEDESTETETLIK